MKRRCKVCGRRLKKRGTDFKIGFFAGAVTVMKLLEVQDCCATCVDGLLVSFFGEDGDDDWIITKN